MEKEMQLINWKEMGREIQDLMLSSLDVKRSKGGFLEYKNKRVRCVQCNRAVRPNHMSLYPIRDFTCADVLCDVEYLTKHNLKVKTNDN